MHLLVGNATDVVGQGPYLGGKNQEELHPHRYSDFHGPDSGWFSLSAHFQLLAREFPMPPNGFDCRAKTGRRLRQQLFRNAIDYDVFLRQLESGLGGSQLPRMMQSRARTNRA